MCIAIVNKAGQRMPDDWLRNSFSYNPDGAGFAYIKDGKVLISKGYMDEHKFLVAYDGLWELYGRDNPMLIHCRIATAGLVNKNNCHPFPIKGGALIHNGHLWSVPNGFNAKKSDTREFAETFYNILNYDDVVKTVEDGTFDEAIRGDRMAMLYDDSRFVMAGDWQEEEQGFFSNGGYKYGRSVRQNVYDDEDWHNYNYCMA